jgi:hypothetical protein
MAYNQAGNPFTKIKGGGTKKVCLPAAKVRSMSKSEREKVKNLLLKALVKKELRYGTGLKTKTGYKLVIQVKNVVRNNGCLQVYKNCFKKEDG